MFLSHAFSSLGLWPRVERRSDTSLSFTFLPNRISKFWAQILSRLSENFIPAKWQILLHAYTFFKRAMVTLGWHDQIHLMSWYAGKGLAPRHVLAFLTIHHSWPNNWKVQTLIIFKVLIYCCEINLIYCQYNFFCKGSRFFLDMWSFPWTTKRNHPTLALSNLSFSQRCLSDHSDKPSPRFFSLSKK